MYILLDEIMQKKNLTVRQVSIVTGIPRTTIHYIANQKITPKIDTMEQLAKGLKVRITDLFESDYK